MKVASLSIKIRKAKTPSFLATSKKYIMIEEFKDEIRDLEKLFNEIKKLEPLREQANNEIKDEIKNETKRKLNMLDDEINNILEKLD